MNKLFPFMAFSILLLVPAVEQIAFAGSSTVTEHDHFDNIVGSMDLILPDGSVKSLSLNGQLWMDVFFEGTTEGDADDDDGDTRDEVSTKIVQMGLAGNHPDLGQLTINLNPNLMSFGSIEEKINNNPGLLDVDPFAPGDADMFSDLFIEINIPLFGTLHNQQAVRIMGTISEKPMSCDDLLENIQDIELFDENNQPTGILLGVFQLQCAPIEHDHFDNIESSMDLILPDGSVKSLSLNGQLWMDVFFEGTTEGDADDDDGDTRDEVSTKIVQMGLAGNHPDLGQLTINLNPNLMSFGSIEEKINNNPGLLDVDPFAPGDANMFSDLFIEINFQDGSILHNEQSLRIIGMISEKPMSCDDLLENLQDVELFDESGQPTGIFIGQIRLQCTEIIDPNPVGGEFIPIKVTSLVLAGAQSFSWMIPVLLSGIGIGLFVVSRKSENS